MQLIIVHELIICSGSGWHICCHHYKNWDTWPRFLSSYEITFKIILTNEIFAPCAYCGYLYETLQKLITNMKKYFRVVCWVVVYGDYSAIGKFRPSTEESRGRSKLLWHLYYLIKNLNEVIIIWHSFLYKNNQYSIKFIQYRYEIFDSDHFCRLMLIAKSQ